MSRAEPCNGEYRCKATEHVHGCYAEKQRLTQILFVAEAGDSVCADVRAKLPAQGLRELGYDVDVVSVVFENVDGKLYGFDGENQTRCPKILVVRHTKGPEGEHWDSADMYRKARLKGQRIFFDIDDDLWHLPDWNPARNWVTPEVQALMVRNMNACDGVLTTTHALATVIEQHVSVPVYVVPNGVDPLAYEPRREERKPLRLGWFGATNWRRPDLELTVPYLKKALDGRRGEVEFWHMGWLPNEVSIREILGPDFPVEVVEYPWVPIQLLPQTCTLVDVAIIPQPEHVFSEARSNISGLRLCAAGIPWAATMTEDYEKLWKMGAGYPVYEKSSWLNAIHVLIDDEYKEARRAIRNGGLAVARFFGPKETAKKYDEIFTND